MLGLAIWMIDRIIPPTVTMYLWAGLFIRSRAIFLLKTKNVIGKAISLAVLALGLLLLIGAVRGATNPLKPLEVSQKSELNFYTIKNEKELDSIISSSTKPIMIDFTAKWCVSCKEFEEITFKDKKVIELMKKFKLLRVDITNNTTEDKKLLKRFELVGPPAIIFFKNKVELKNKKVVGYKEPKVFIKVLEGIK
jgi:thiol:disulfide interchange protein DsbD